MEENAVALLGVAEILGNLGPAAILVIHVEEPFGAAPLMDGLHGESSLVIGGGECIGEPAIVLHGPLRLPKIENGLETFHLRGREPVPKQPMPNLVEEEFAIDLAGHCPLSTAETSRGYNQTRGLG